MAQVTADSVKVVPKGVNDGTHQHHYAAWTGSWANGDTMLIALPAYEKGGGMVDYVACFSDSGTTVGSRVRTHAAVSVSFNEATGVVTVTNENGGTVTNPKFVLHYTSLHPI